MNIYISNLSFNVHDEDLKSLFAPHGDVSSAKIVNDRVTGKSRGFGFVQMADDAQANKAIAALNGDKLGGRTLQVTEARQKSSVGFAGSGLKINALSKVN